MHPSVRRAFIRRVQEHWRWEDRNAAMTPQEERREFDKLAKRPEIKRRLDALAAGNPLDEDVGRRVKPQPRRRRQKANPYELLEFVILYPPPPAQAGPLALIL